MEAHKRRNHWDNVRAHALRCPECGYTFGGTDQTFGCLQITIDQRCTVVTLPGREEVRFTPLESLFIAAMAASNGRVLTRDYIYDQLYWDRAEHDIPEPKILDVLICKIRRKIELWDLPLHIESVWGRGWILTEKRRAESTAA